MTRNLVLALAAAALAGCAVGPDFHRPVLTGPERYAPQGDAPATASAGGAVQRFGATDAGDSRWWVRFGSPTLDALVDRGVDGSPSLAAAQATLRESQAQLWAGAGVFLPSVTGAGGASRDHASLGPPGLAAGSETYSLFTLSASVSYVLDIFGGERRSVEALAAQRDQQRDLYAAAWVTLTSNIANTAIAEAAYKAEARTVRQIIADEAQELTSARQRVAAGTDTYATVLQIQSAMAANQALLPTLEQQQVAAQNLLATLSGKSPGDFQDPDLDLASLRLPADLPLTLPSEFARRRPDILASEANLHAASAQVGVATAAMFPQITLGASYGVENVNSASLFTPASALWSAGAAIAAPIFEGGTLLNRRRAAVAAYDAALADYHGVVLSAFGQVADTLRALEHDAEVVAADEAGADAADQADRLGRANQEAGLISASDLLALDIQREQARLQLIQGQAQRYQDTVALYAALGGGWWNAPSLAKAASPMEPGR